MQVRAHRLLRNAQRSCDLAFFHVLLPTQHRHHVLPLWQALDDLPAPLQRD